MLTLILSLVPPFSAGHGCAKGTRNGVEPVCHASGTVFRLRSRDNNGWGLSASTVARSGNARKSRQPETKHREIVPDSHMPERTLLEIGKYRQETKSQDNPTRSIGV
ncbi:hypothetical protein K461DRAFT_279282 [Myriangium duriaei CBS 260.36]|uniref:Secreted protein n=1 Tax=Myriangium duriaei CBS 260.36 TaxID=1168546 RepID=A0A9P4IZX2_9PEZI|nr:hypothetical protein K461DRAFT_279282 [Myriangium duriaei CBS 260.36]